MKIVSALLSACLFIILTGFTNPEVAHTAYQVDTELSSLVWTGKKVTGKHTGTIDINEGTLHFDDQSKLIGGSFTADMTSIVCTDLEGEWKGKLEGHLKSSDFFGVDEHPKANFEIKKVDFVKDNEYNVIGDFTIKGITHEASFTTKVSLDNGDGVATADLTIDRTEYDIRYGSGSFFDNLGDKTIDDAFELSVKLVFKK